MKTLIEYFESLDSKTFGLSKYINEQLGIYINEGGAGGHMAHPFDYADFTGNDLLDLVDNLFAGKIEHMKEKLDGFNIGATKNMNNEVVFIRNDSDASSEKHGMSIEDMMEKWATAERQKKVYKMAGEIITQILKDFPVKYFNPDPETLKVINCECIVAGKTNVMPYATDRVAFHGYKLYHPNANGRWKGEEDIEGHVDDIYKAAEGLDAAKPRPDLVIKSAESASKFAEQFKKELTQLFKSEDLDMSKSIEEWKKARYKKLAPDWIKDDDEMCNRICCDDKSVNTNIFKKRYPEHKDELTGDPFKKKLVNPLIGKIMEPMDLLFLHIGNELIDILDGFTNSGTKDKVIASLKTDMETTIDAVKNSDNIDAQEKIEKQLGRLKALGDKYNVAEGIVLMYKGRRMKLTGSFAAINQILGTRFDLEKINKI